jgi:hypothetical protein
MNCSRFAAAGFAAMAIWVALPSVASAADYCVAPNYDCGPNNFQKLQDALQQAASTQEADRVLLGEGTYVAPANQFAFFYNAPQSPVEIVGAGRNRTLITAPTNAIDRVFLLNGGPDSSVHDLTIRIPPKVGEGLRGLVLMTSTARQLDVVADENQGWPIRGADILNDAVLEDSSIALNTSKSTTGVYAGTMSPGDSATVRNTTVVARTGVESIGFTTVDRSRITGGDVGMIARGPDITVRNSLVRQTDTFGALLKAETRSGTDTKLTADGVTLVGQATPDVSGIVATTGDHPAQSIDVDVSNSLIRGAANSLAAATPGIDAGTAKIHTSYSDYDPAGNLAFGATIDSDHATNVGDAGFVDPANGDFRLGAGSPLVDRGDPDVAQGLDIDGNPLVADGNGDGFARRDLGAFELQPAPPTQGDTQAPVITAFHARRSRVSYRLSESARIVVKVQRRLPGKRTRYRTLGTVAKPAKQGANRLKLSRRIRAKDARPGRYRAVIVAIDAAGNHSTKKAAAFRVSR